MKIIDLFPYRRLSEHSSIKHSYLFLNEAVYDVKLASLKKKFPDQISDIDAQLNWAKSIFKTPGQINWWCNLYGDYLENKLSTKQLGDYQFKSIDELQVELSHYFGFSYHPILTFVFDNKTVKQILTDLSTLETQYLQKQKKDRPVEMQEGDRTLYEFPGGIEWILANRAFCPEEGRSGDHCGNITGKNKTKQRILSLRRNGNVLLTFILEPDGTLGEMKAKHNQRPAPAYHEHIFTLLMGNDPKIVGISGMGYLPEMNFNVFDFDENKLQQILKSKPELIKTQLKVTPMEFMKAPLWIKQNPELREVACNSFSGLKYLIDEAGKINNNPNAWEKAMYVDNSLILHAPDTVDHYTARLLEYLSNDPVDLLKAPSNLRKDYEFLCSLIDKNPSALHYISPTVQKYEDLILRAVTQDGSALTFVSEDALSEKICLAAVKVNGMSIYYVPQKWQTEKICLVSVKQDGQALSHISREMRTGKVCLTAVTQNGYALQYVPKELRNEKICVAAVTQEYDSFQYVPTNLREIVRSNVM